MATVQTPFFQMDEASMTEIALALPGSEETPLPTSLEPTYAPGEAMGMSATPSQTSANPYQFESTQISPIASATLGINSTPLPPPGSPAWEGIWNIWYQNSTGAYISSVMSIQVSGIQFSGTATINSVDYTFKGDFNLEGNEAQGKWKTTQADGNLWWQMISPNTFVGSRESRFGFCGDRVSADRPGSCRKLPAN